MDPDEDSDNSSVYVQGLNDNVTLEDLADFFKQCGVVKVRGTRVRGSAPACLQRAEHREGDWACPARRWSPTALSQQLGRAAWAISSPQPGAAV